MRVCHITNYFPGLHGHIGGAEQACLRTALLTQPAGLEHHIVATLPDPALVTKNLIRCQFPYTCCPTIERYAGSLAAKYLEAIKWYVWQHDPLAVRAFDRCLRTVHPQVVHFHNFQFLTFALAERAKRYGAATCASIYDYWLLCPNVMLLDHELKSCRRFHGSGCVDCLPPQFRLAQKWLLSMRRRIFDRYLKLIDRFVVLSEHSAGVLQDYGIKRDRIAVIPLSLPVDLARPPQAGPVDGNLIVFAGWLNLRKGPHLLLEAMPHILAEVPHAKLLLIGGTVKFGEEYQQRMQSLVATHHLNPHVQFAGHLPAAEVQKHLLKAAVVAIPEQYENMCPLLLIESMALARPVVASRAGGIPEFVEDGVTGFLADPRDPKDFAAKIIRVLKNPAPARAMAERGQAAVLKKCDSNRIAALTAALYEQLGGRKS